MRPTFAFLSLVLAGSGCNTPPKEAHDGAAVPAASASSPASPASPPATASASAAPLASAAPPASAAACTSDADCRTFSSYCAEAPCACRVLLASAPDPRCLGTTKVNCFADPCMKKTASCQAGACVLTAK